MSGITGNTLRSAAKFVDECGERAEIHTVTLVTNGAHGGVDLVVKGTAPDVRGEPWGEPWGEVEYERKWPL
jgi:hypothetical protein